MVWRCPAPAPRRRIWWVVLEEDREVDGQAFFHPRGPCRGLVGGARVALRVGQEAQRVAAQGEGRKEPPLWLEKSKRVLDGRGRDCGTRGV